MLYAKTLLFVSSLFTSVIAFGMDSKATVTLFAHGILDTGKQVLKYTGKENGSPAIITAPYATFNFPDAGEGPCGMKLCKFWHCSFGQNNDIKALASAHEQTSKQFPNHNHVLMGMSRGASVILSYVAVHQPKNVQALVLESPFDTVPAVLDAAADHVPDLIKYQTTRAAAVSVLKNIAREYDSSAPQPIDLIDNLPSDLPMLLISSQEDKLVPAARTYAIYQKLKNRGHQHVYLLRLAKGKHSKLLHDTEGLKYAQVVHAFYKKYGLPHDPVLATQGEPLLRELQVW